MTFIPLNGQFRSFVCLFILLLMALPIMATSKTGKSRKAKPAQEVSAAAPTNIYRCGNVYQSVPCAGAASGVERKIILQDQQTPDQIQAALQSKKKLIKQADTIDKANKKAMLAAQRKPSQPIGLSCHVPGSRPFDTCNKKSASEKTKKTNQKKKTQDKHGPYFLSLPR